MHTYSWIINCTKKQWKSIKTKKIQNQNDRIYIKRFLGLAIILMIEPKRIKSVHERQDIIHEKPITLCIAKTTFSQNEMQLKGFALFNVLGGFLLSILIPVVALLTNSPLAVALATIFWMLYIVVGDASNIHSLNKIEIMLSQNLCH